MEGSFGAYLRGGLMVSAAIVCVAAATPAMAQSRNFNLPAQDAASGVSQFARQAEIQLLISARAASGRRTNAVRGAMSVDEGLRRLLEGTGLRAQLTGPRTYSVLLSGEIEAGSAAAETGSAEQGATAEILVVGARTQNADIRRTENDAQPYVVLGREEIQQSQAGTIEDFLRTRLPQNTTQTTNAQTAFTTFGSQSSINLRGLGANQTLILVDGRRMPSVYSGQNFGQPDINGIPIGAVERIEILPSTASGIYGGGATGGVINIILRRDYTGAELGGRWTAPLESGGSDRRVDATLGLDLASGRIHVLLAGSHSESDPLLVGDRSFAEQGRALQFVNNPNSFFAANPPPLGYTPNVRSANGSNLVLDNGTPLGSPRTYIPLGYGGPATDGGMALVANAGSYNLALPNDVIGLRQSLLNNPTMDSLSANVRGEITDRLEAFADFSWYRNQGSAFVGNVSSFVTLPANAPNNPFTTAITVRFPSPNINVRFRSESETLRAAAGLIYRLSDNWSVGADYSWSRSRLTFIQTSPILNSAANAAFANGTLDVMRDVNAFPLDFGPYALPSPNSIYGPIDTDLRDASLRLSGSLFRLPGGKVTITGLLEHREEVGNDGFRDNLLANGAANVTYFPERSQRVNSAYLETQLPLVGPQNGVPFVHSLTVSASIRRDEYSTTTVPPLTFTLPDRNAPLPAITETTRKASSTDYTLSLRYAPVPDILLRASYGTGFLAPSIAQLTSQTFFGELIFVADPRRDNVMTIIAPVDVTSGGNPDLVPERSGSLSFGMVLTPRFLPNLRLSIDYTRIRKDREIITLPDQLILDNEALFPGRVVRGPNLPGDPPGWAGPIIAFNNTALNASATTVEALDFQVEYALELPGLGRFTLNGLAAYEPHFRRRLFPAAAMVEFAGYNGGPLEWRGNLGLVWDRGPWTLGWNAQYFDSYRVFAADAPAASVANLIVSQGSDRVRSQTYHDAFVRYRVGGGALEGSPFQQLEVTLGVQNLFNAEPPTLATAGSAGGYSTYGDPRLRRVSLSVRARFGG